MVYAYELSALDQHKSGRKLHTSTEAGYHILQKNVIELLSRLDLQSHTSLKNRILERLAALPEKDIHLVQSILSALKKQNPGN